MLSTASPPLAPREACAAVPMGRTSVTQPTSSRIPSYLGVYHTPATDTTTGLGCTVGWSGTAFSPPPSPTLSQWASRAGCSTRTRTDWCQPGSVPGVRDSPTHTSSTEHFYISTDRLGMLCP